MKLFIKENRKKPLFAGMVIEESKLIKTLIILKGDDITNYINVKHSCQEFSLFQIFPPLKTCLVSDQN